MRLGNNILLGSADASLLGFIEDSELFPNLLLCLTSVEEYYPVAFFSQMSLPVVTTGRRIDVVITTLNP
jgi:hypothetical protein